MKKIMLWAIILITTNQTVYTQRQFTNNTPAWFMYIGTHKFAPKWSLHLEGQWRRNEVVAKPLQNLLRVGVNYHLHPQVSATVGFAFIKTYPYGAFPARSEFPENRFWEQVQIKNQIWKIEGVSRFRLEQRYVNAPVLIGNGIYQAGDAVYTNRFRYLQRFSIPFNGTTIGPKSFYATVFDELFVNFGKKVAFNIFDQNRFCVGLGYVIPKVGRAELGYLNQRVIKSDGIKVEKNHVIQMALLANMDFMKPNEEAKKSKR